MKIKIKNETKMKMKKKNKEEKRKRNRKINKKINRGLYWASPLAVEGARSGAASALCDAVVTGPAHLLWRVRGAVQPPRYAVYLVCRL